MSGDAGPERGLAADGVGSPLWPETPALGRSVSPVSALLVNPFLMAEADPALRMASARRLPSPSKSACRQRLSPLAAGPAPPAATGTTRGVTREPVGRYSSPGSRTTSHASGKHV
eukprot:EG_transcript_30360